MKIPPETVKRKLIRFVRRKRITEAVLCGEAREAEEWIKAEGVNLIEKDGELISFAGEAVIRLARSMGLKKGSVSLGIYSEKHKELLLDNMKKAADWLSAVYVFGECINGEAFFNETGISVVITDKINFPRCSILAAEGEYDGNGFEGGVIRVGGAPFGEICVTGLRLDIPEELRVENLPDYAVSVLFNIAPEITRLVVRKNKN